MQTGALCRICGQTCRVLRNHQFPLRLHSTGPFMLQRHCHNFTFRNHHCNWALQREHSHLNQMGTGSRFERGAYKVVTFSWGADITCSFQVLLAPLSCDVPSYLQHEIKKKCSRVIKAGNNRLWKSPKPTSSYNCSFLSQTNCSFCPQSPMFFQFPLRVFVVVVVYLLFFLG